MEVADEVMQLTQKLDKMKIEVVKLRGDDAPKFQASLKQMYYIKALMENRGMNIAYNTHFCIQGKTIQNHLTIVSAGKLIDALKQNKEIQFVEKTI